MIRSFTRMGSRKLEMQFSKSAVSKTSKTVELRKIWRNGILKNQFNILSNLIRSIVVYFLSSLLCAQWSFLNKIEQRSCARHDGAFHRILRSSCVIGRVSARYCWMTTKMLNKISLLTCFLKKKLVAWLNALY